ncbi:MAG: M50 family metallopeptidase [Bradymonadia bacterium]
MSSSALSAHDRSRLFLIAGTVITGLLYVIPGGHYVAYPLMLLSTLAHEMGHGLSAVLVGGDFLQLEMWSDGSGRATWAGHVGRVAQAFVAAGGLVGPSVVAAAAFGLGRTEKGARIGLVGIGVFLIISALWVVRGQFALAFVGVTALICLLLALKTKPWVSQVALVFLGVQLALSVFSRGDYLFTDVAITANGPMPSDVAQMAEALWLPYWVWGGLCGAFSIVVLILGLRPFLRRD